MAKKKEKGTAAPTKAERQEALKDRNEIPVSRREEKMVEGLEKTLENATADWE